MPRLLEAMRFVDAGLGLHTTLDRITAIAAALADARCAAIAVLPREGEGKAEYVFHGVDDATCERIRTLPEGHTGMRAALARAHGQHPDRGRHSLDVAIRVHGSLFGLLCLAEKRDADEFTDDDLVLARAIATEAGIAIGNSRLYEEASQRERWIDGTAAVTTALLTASDADEALQVIAEQAGRLSDSIAAAVLLPAEEGGIEVVAVASDRAREALGRIVSTRSKVVRQVLAGEAVFIEDAATHPWMTDDIARSYGPTMVLPLQSSGRVLGGLITQRKRGGRQYTRTERTLATRFASQAALALMLADAQRDRERLAVYEDRDRIARDLHDLVIQRLFATGMTLESAHRGSHEPEVRTGVEKAVDELDVTIQEIRGAIFALQQGPTERQPGLRARVLREIGMSSVLLGFRPGHHFAGPVDAVDPVTGKNLIAALREMLSNAYRHAHAGRIEVVVDATVTLADGRPGVRLSVADDGVGIPEDGRRSGLANLERRAESLGGASWRGGGIGQGGAGTTVYWQAPGAPAR
ncbi:GAF domain-containing sensor histidine kinase [Streptomyces sp. NA04227]|uniref:GAF domain-containing sensor histidine kinase n=1 Tax=Streptomyces sp. NA04227 TaxID=2742136 RepID=UPI0020CA44A3|nr:GAF domain-containing protein [Streptomyces sp. NA04227]